MKTAKWPLYFSICSTSLLALSIVFFFFLETYVNFWFAAIVTLFLAIMNIISLVLASGKKYYKIAFTQCILLLVFVLSMFVSVSRFIFFGAETGQIYHGEDFGFHILKFYSRGTCVVEYGGIAGTTDINYSEWIVKGDTIYIPTGWNPYVSDGPFAIAGKEYFVKGSPDVHPQGPERTTLPAIE